jgi:hypothetical protein
MRRLVRTAVVFLFASAAAAPAFAQGYVGAFLIADVARFDQYAQTGRGDSGNGEALGFALPRHEVGSRWGVDLEFVRPGEISNEVSPDILPLLTQPTPALPSIPGLPSLPPELVFPTYSYRFRTTQRNSTLSTALWVRQEISSRVSLAYLGGVAFGRTREVEVTYEASSCHPDSPSVSETTTYDVGPMVASKDASAWAGR